MADNFKVIKGVTEDGVPVDPMLTTEQVDAIDEFAGAKIAVGMVYKGERHVTRVWCVRGCLPHDLAYAKTISYNDIKFPIINYKDTKTGEHFAETSAEFLEWLGKDWVAEEAQESEETKEKNRMLEQLGGQILATQEPDKKQDELEDKKEEDKDKANWKPIKPRPKKKSTRQSKKS